MFRKSLTDVMSARDFFFFIHRGAYPPDPLYSLTLGCLPGTSSLFTSLQLVGGNKDFVPEELGIVRIVLKKVIQFLQSIWSAM